MANIECYNFTLKTRDINSSLTYADYFNTTIVSSNGEIRDNRTNYTWYNIPIMNIIGPDNYKIYDRFNITLNSYSMTQRGAAADTDDNNTVYIQMSGLGWITSYDNVTKMNNSWQTIKLLKINPAASISECQYFYDKTYYTFSKNANNLNLSIRLMVVSTDAKPFYDVAGKLLGHLSFNFSIYPIIDKKI